LITVQNNIKPCKIVLSSWGMEMG